MAREVFQAVQTAENKADQFLQEAHRDARELIKSTQAEIAANERSVVMEHRAMYQSILDEKRESVQVQIQAGKAAVRTKHEAILADARGQLAQAAEQIVERVWNDGNR